MATQTSPSPAREVRGVVPKLVDRSEPCAMSAAKVAKSVLEGKKA